jgi:hypothetical protein
MKVVSAHQPHFLPWLGYFNKVFRSDVFIWLEDVQFRKNYFQNRTKIKSNSGELWLSVSVKKAPLETNINEIEIALKKDMVKASKTLRTYYSKAKHFKSCFPKFEEILLQDYKSLNDLDYDLFKLVLTMLDIDTKVIKSTDLLDKQFEDPNDRLLAMCKAVEATHYIAGKGGRNYMNQEAFTEKGIEILWQDFPSNTIAYEQLHGEFIGGLSIVDALFNMGVDKTKELIETPWQEN